MSDQKKLKITVNDLISSDNSGSRDTTLGSKQKRTRRSQNPIEEDLSKWRGKAHNVQERNLIALKNSLFTDITVEVGPENTPFQAHKLILTLGSPVFEAMFFGPLAKQEEKISIPDIMPDGFKVLLSYLYGDIISIDNEVEALNAWFAADKYCIPELKSECNTYFSSCALSSSNIWILLETAVFLNLVSLISRCMQYLKKHFDSSLCGEGFLGTKTETIKVILSMSSVNVSELVLLKSVVHWGRHKVDTGVAASLAEVLKPLLPHIRFGALTPAEFCKFLDETKDLLDNSDSLAIIKHLTEPASYDLPEWCCGTIWKRSSIIYADLPSSDSPRRKETKKPKKY